jgi:cytochrome P450
MSVESTANVQGDRGAGEPRPLLDHFSLTDPDFLADPYVYFGEMRHHSPVFPSVEGGESIYLVTTDKLCREVLEDPSTYSSHFSLQGKPSAEAAARGKALREELGGYPRVNMLVTEDPPRHTRFRKLVASAFTPRAMAKWQEGFTQIAYSLIDDFDGATQVEFRRQFTDPLGMRAIAMVLGVEDSRLDDFARWANHTLIGHGTAAVTDEEYLDAQRSIVEFQLYFADIIAQRRANPQDDLVTRLVNARLNPTEAENSDGDPLTDPELLEMLQTLLGAAGHTTTRALTEMFHQLALHPDWWQTACTTPDSRRSIIEESVRFAAPAVALWRRSTRETELGGVRIPARAKLLVSFGSATRDESVIVDPTVFNPDRTELKTHLAWGRGIHACLGQNLARSELRVALDVLTERLAGVALMSGTQVEYERNFMARGIVALPLDITYR